MTHLLTTLTINLQLYRVTLSHTTLPTSCGLNMYAKWWPPFSTTENQLSLKNLFECRKTYSGLVYLTSGLSGMMRIKVDLRVSMVTFDLFWETSRPDLFFKAWFFCFRVHSLLEKTTRDSLCLTSGTFILFYNLFR